MAYQRVLGLAPLLLLVGSAMPVEASLAEPAEFSVECSVACDLLPPGSVVLFVDGTLQEAMQASPECQDAVQATLRHDVRSDGAVTEVEECLDGALLYTSEQDARYFVSLDSPVLAAAENEPKCGGIFLGSLIEQTLAQPQEVAAAISNSMSGSCEVAEIIVTIIENVTISTPTNSPATTVA